MKRFKTKQLDFAYLIRQYLDDKGFVWEVKVSWQQKRAASDRFKSWYSRAYSGNVKTVSALLVDTWLVMKPSEIAR